MARMLPTQSIQLLEQLLGPHDAPSAELQKIAVAQIEDDHYQLITAIQHADAMMYSEASMALMERIIQHPRRVNFDIIELVGHMSIPGKHLIDCLAQHGLLGTRRDGPGGSWNLAAASVYYGRHDVLKALLDVGEDPHQTVVLHDSMEPENLLDYANRLGKWKCAILLQCAGAFPTKDGYLRLGCDMPSDMEETLVSNRSWVNDAATDFYCYYQSEPEDAVKSLLRRVTTLSGAAQQALLNSFVLLLSAHPGNESDVTPLGMKIKALRDVYIQFQQTDTKDPSLKEVCDHLFRFDTQTEIGATMQFSLSVAVLFRPTGDIRDEMQQEAKALLLELLSCDRAVDEGWRKGFGALLRWANCTPVVTSAEWDALCLDCRTSFGHALVYTASPWTKPSGEFEEPVLIPLEVVSVN